MNSSIIGKGKLQKLDITELATGTVHSLTNVNYEVQGEGVKFENPKNKHLLTLFDLVTVYAEDRAIKAVCGNGKLKLEAMPAPLDDRELAVTLSYAPGQGSPEVCLSVVDIKPFPITDDVQFQKLAFSFHEAVVGNFRVSGGATVVFFDQPEMFLPVELTAQSVLRFHSIVTDETPATLMLTGMGQMGLDEVHVGVQTDAKKWSVTTRGAITLSNVPPPLNGPFANMTVTFTDEDSDIIINPQQLVVIAAGFGFDNYSLRWRWSKSQQRWKLRDKSGVTLHLFDQPIELQATPVEVGEQWILSFAIDEKTQLELADLGTCKLSKLKLQGKADDTDEWDLQVEGKLTLDTFPAPLNDPFAVTLTHQDGQLFLSISDNRSLSIVDEFSIQKLHLEFTWNQDKQWTVKGGTSATILGKTFELAATFSGGDGEQCFSLGWTSSDALPLLSLDSILTLDIAALKLTVVRNTEADYRWALTTTSTLAIADTFTLRGGVELYGEDSQQGLIFAPGPDSIYQELTLPLIQDSTEMMLTTGMALEQIAIIHKTSDWCFETGVSLRLTGFDESVQQAIPESIAATFMANKEGVGLTVDQVIEPISIVLPPISFHDKTIPLGTISFAIENFKVTLGHQLAVCAELKANLPAELDNIFGVDDTGQPIHNFLADEIDLALGVDSEQGLYFQLRSSLVPPALGAVEIENGEVWQSLNLGDFGQVWAKLPKVTFTESAFSASGGFKHKELGLPLTFIKDLLEQHDLEAIAAIIPDKISLTEFDFLDENGELDINSMITWLKGNPLLQTVDFPIDEIGDALVQVADHFNQLPDTFQEYLHFALPDQFTFDIEFTFAGAVRFDIKAEGDKPVKLLQPAMIRKGPIFIPGLRGVQLRHLAYGTLLGGSLALLEVDALMDEFDIVTLGASLALPSQATLLLPNPNELHQRFVIGDLLMLIVYETAIPLPIPLFYRDLGYDGLALPGLGLGLKAQFPQPSKFDLLDLITLVKDLKDFLIDPDYLLPSNFFDQHDLPLHFAINPGYVQLPKYVSGASPAVYGEKEQELWRIDLAATFAEALNTAKNPRLGRIVRFLPLEKRVGAQKINFGPMSIAGAWAITTDQEFNQVLDNSNQLPVSEFKDKLEAIPAEQRSQLLEIIRFDPNYPATDKGDGAIILTLGDWKIADKLNFNVQLGLAQSMSMGYGCGFAIAGDVAKFVDFEAKGGVLVNVNNQESPLLLNGDSYLNILGRRIFNGDIQLNGDGFKLDGQFNLFPPSSALQVSGEGHVNIAKDGGVHLLTDANVSLDNFKLLGSRVELANNSLELRGVFLEQQATLRSKIEDNELLLQGKLKLPLTFSLNTGPLYEPLTGWKIVDNIDLKRTGLVADLDVEIGSQGFAAEVAASFCWNGKQITVPTFTLYTPPTSINALVNEIVTQIKNNASALFATILPTVGDWLQAATDGWVTLAKEFSVMADAAKEWCSAAWDAIQTWSAGAWAATRWWSAEAWATTKKWPTEAWEATITWTAAAWQATTQWRAEAWQAICQWSTTAWQATQSWTAGAWHATTQWIDEAWAATVAWADDAWTATMSWTSEIWQATTQWSQTFWEDTGKWAAECWKDFQKTFKTTLDSAVEILQTVLKDIQGILQERIDGILNKISEAVGIGEETVIDLIKGMNNVVATIKSVLDKISEAVGVGEETVIDLIKGMNDVVATIKSMLDKVPFIASDSEMLVVAPIATTLEDKD